MLVWIWEVDHWLPELYAVILGVYAVAAVLWLIAVLRGPVPRWADWASTIVDLLVIVALCLVSGGATSALLPVFFLLPISVAFGDRPCADGDFRHRHGGRAISPSGSSIPSATTESACRTSCTRISASCCGWPSRRPRCASCSPEDRCASRHYRRYAASWCPRRCRPTSGATARWPSTCTTARCRRCSPRGSNSTRPVSATPIPRSTWFTRHCRKPRPACGRPSPNCTRRCSRSSGSPLRCERW